MTENPKQWWFNQAGCLFLFHVKVERWLPQDGRVDLAPWSPQKPRLLLPWGSAICGLGHVTAQAGTLPAPALRSAFHQQIGGKKTDISRKLRIAFFSNFLFCTGVWLINKQYCDSFRPTVKGPSHTYTCIHSLPDSPPIQATMLRRVPCAMQ